MPCNHLNMEKRTDRLMAAYVDLAFNVAVSFGLEAGMRVLQHKTPLLVIQRVLIEVGPRRGAPSVTPEPFSTDQSRT